MAIARTRKRAWPGPGVLSSIRQRGLALLSWELIYGAKMWKERNGSARLITAEVHDAQLAKSLQASIGHGAFFFCDEGPQNILPPRCLRAGDGGWPVGRICEEDLWDLSGLRGLYWFCISAPFSIPAPFFFCCCFPSLLNWYTETDHFSLEHVDACV